GSLPGEVGRDSTRGSVRREQLRTSDACISRNPSTTGVASPGLPSEPAAQQTWERFGHDPSPQPINGDDTMRTRTTVAAAAMIAAGTLLGWLAATFAQDKKPAEVTPKPPPDFKGEIKLDIRDSKPDWAPFTPKAAPKGAPN